MVHASGLSWSVTSCYYCQLKAFLGAFLASTSLPGLVCLGLSLKVAKCCYFLYNLNKSAGVGITNPTRKFTLKLCP
jgi:hypothetical protein